MRQVLSQSGMDWSASTGVAHLARLMIPSMKWQQIQHGLLHGTALECRGGAGVHLPVATWKAHDGAITSLTFYRHLGDTPEQPPIKLATAGEYCARQNMRSDGSLPLPKSTLLVKVAFELRALPT